MNKHQRYELFQRLKQENPKPRTELHFNSTFELLIAVILSAQATDVSVNKATEALFKKANTPEKLLALDVDGLKPFIKSIGLYNSKARNIIQTCRILIETFHSKVPKERKALESLPGVGRKTANVILNTAFGFNTIAVDTHIFRVSNRAGLAKGETPRVIEEKLMKLVPLEFQKDAHHWLVLHGRYTCTARKPRCPECVIRDLCEYPNKTVKL